MLLPLLVYISDSGACVSVCCQPCGPLQRLRPELQWVVIMLVMCVRAFRLAYSQLLL